MLPYHKLERHIATAARVKNCTIEKLTSVVHCHLITAYRQCIADAFCEHELVQARLKFHACGLWRSFRRHSDEEMEGGGGGNECMAAVRVLTRSIHEIIKEKE